MNENLKSFRNVFVNRLSASGCTRIYFGDVIRLFDEVLEEHAAYLTVDGLPVVTLSDRVGALAEDGHAPTADDFKLAEEAAKLSAVASSTRGKPPAPSMAADEEQENAEELRQLERDNAIARAQPVPTAAPLEPVPSFEDADAIAARIKQQREADKKERDAKAKASRG